MQLTDLVPPIELCKLIPEGEFQDSCFLRLDGKPYTIIERRLIRKEFGRQEGVYPAPTLHEIMDELSLCDGYSDTGWFCLVGDPDNWQIGNCECDLYVRNETESDSPEAAALKVWLKKKGIEA